MEKTSKDQYGRKSWNVEAYEQEAKRGPHKRKAETTLEKSHRINESKALSYITHRAHLINDAIGKVKVHSIIDPTDLLVGGHVKFGFTCPVCNFSFKDNLALIDHINSPQHLAKVKEISGVKHKSSNGDDEDEEDDETEELDGGIRRATLKDVINTMEAMVEKEIKNRTPDQLESIQDRTLRRKQFEEQWQQKRRKQRQQQRKNKTKNQTASVDSDSDNEALALAMGFLAFGRK